MYKLCFQGWSQVTRQMRGWREAERHSLRVFKQARRRALLKDMSILPVKCVG